MSEVDPGLCASCAHAKKLETRRGSSFHLCTAPSLPKYPQLPVRRCASHAPRERGADEG